MALRTKTMSFRRNVGRSFKFCLAIGAGIAGLFGLAMIVSAFVGRNSASDILLGGLGFIILIVSVLAVVYVVVSLRSSGPDADE
jgi:Na+/melibiose symporter-like transporter